MVKLFANVEAIKTTSPSPNEFKNSYLQFLYGFCNGYVNCRTYYYKNIENQHKNNQMPFDTINAHQAGNITKDYILLTSYSDFINNSHNDIYSKLKRIKDYGTAKTLNS